MVNFWPFSLSFSEDFYSKNADTRASAEEFPKKHLA